MDSSEGEEIIEEEQKKRGRPPGKQDQKPRYRRTAEEISADKLRIAEMKLTALRESEERKLATKKTRAPRKVTESTLEAPKKVIKAPPPPPKEESPSPRPVGSRRQALYGSWFPTSPRSSRY